MLAVVADRLMQKPWKVATLRAATPHRDGEARERKRNTNQSVARGTFVFSAKSDGRSMSPGVGILRGAIENYMYASRLQRALLCSAKLNRPGFREGSLVTR